MKRLWFTLALTTLALQCGRRIWSDLSEQADPHRRPLSPAAPSTRSLAMVRRQVSESLGQPIIVEESPGGGRQYRRRAVAEIAARRLHILQNTNGQAISPSIYARSPSTSCATSSRVTQLVASQLVLVASPSSPPPQSRELIALAKAKPGSLNTGMTGVGNPLHLTMEMFKTAAGIDIQTGSI